MAKRRVVAKAAHSIKNHWLAGLLLGTFCAAGTAAAAVDDDTRWYQVELIVFSHNDPQALDAEQWPEIVGVELPLEQLVELRLPADPPAADEQQAMEDIAAETLPPTIPADAGPEMPPASDETAEAETPAMPVAFEILGEEEWQLTETANRLRRSSRFQPLLHVAWRQPTHELARARPVLLYDGMTEPLELPEPAVAGDPADSEGETAPQTLPPIDSEYHAEPVYATAEDARIGPPNPRLVGTVKLSVARYLHFATDLLYRLPVTQQAAVPVPDFDLWYDRPYPTLKEPQGPAYRLEEWQAMRGFRMFESRRMRSKVMHYLDHPLFGLVVLVTPVELPQAQDDTAAGDTQ